MSFALLFRILLALQLTGLPQAIAKPVKKSAEIEPQPQTQPIADDEDDEPEKFERPGQDECESEDPYTRCPEAAPNDGVCDPTLMTKLYKKYEWITCQFSFEPGTCANLNQDVLLYGGISIGAGFSTYQYGKLSLTTKLQNLKSEARLAKLEGKELTAKEAKELAEIEAKFVAQSEKLKLMSKARLLGKAGAVGLGAMGIMSAYYMYAGNEPFEKKWQALQDRFVSKLVCNAPEEQDQYFKDFVPVAPMTCRTPLYQIGHPKVVAFLAAPLLVKEKALQNKLVCGFYKSLNLEIDKRIAMEEGRVHIEKVRCDQGTGQIDFQIKKGPKEIDSEFFSISRRPNSQEFSSYQYTKTIKGKLQEKALFDLAKIEDDIQLVKSTFYMSEFEKERIVPARKMQSFEEQNPVRATDLFSAFRLVRRVSRTLSMCCDLDAPIPPTTAEKLDPKKRENVKKRKKQIANYEKLCPKEWFESSPRAPVTATGAPVKGAR